MIKGATGRESGESSIELAVIGGSGLYSFFDEPATIEVQTPFGRPSAPVTIGSVEGRPVAFLPRHGRGHTHAPHRIPYRANIWALASLGVRALITSTAVGGLRSDLAPLTYVVPDQIIDHTVSRARSFYGGDDDEGVRHLAAADPFDPVLRQLVLQATLNHAARVEGRGTVVVIEGPRFSTRAESALYAEQGGDIIGMTLAPETFLAQEAGMAVATLSVVTDSDAAVEAGHVDAVSADLVLARFAAEQPTVRQILQEVIRQVPSGHCGLGFGPEALEALLNRPVLKER